MIPWISIVLTAAMLLIPAASRGEEPTALDFLPAVLHNAEGEEIEASSLEGKFVGVYFSAHWCPPCRSFTPKLVEFRDKNVDQNFEVVFVSFDNSDDEKAAYIEEAEMKWPSFPGSKTEEANALALKVEIQGLPTLAVFAPDGTLITTDGRQHVLFSPKKALTKWKAARQS